MDIKQELQQIVDCQEPLHIKYHALQILCQNALGEIERLEKTFTSDRIDTQMELIPEDQAWQDRRRFDLLFAAAITGLTSRKKRGTTDTIAREAALVALNAMGHRLPMSWSNWSGRNANGV